MAALKRHENKSVEAGLKYVLYGGVAAGVMLYGVGHIYGILGTINFLEIREGLGLLLPGQQNLLIIAFLCFFVGLGFKLACFPFHMWGPDVYEGSPIPVTAFFSIVPKLAAIAALTRGDFCLFCGKCRDEGKLDVSASIGGHLNHGGGQYFRYRPKIG